LRGQGSGSLSLRRTAWCAATAPGHCHIRRPILRRLQSVVGAAGRLYALQSAAGLVLGRDPGYAGVTATSRSRVGKQEARAGRHEAESVKTAVCRLRCVEDIATFGWFEYHCETTRLSVPLHPYFVCCSCHISLTFNILDHCQKSRTSHGAVQFVLRRRLVTSLLDLVTFSSLPGRIFNLYNHTFQLGYTRRLIYITP
jgi:hypothetical protein